MNMVIINAGSGSGYELDFLASHLEAGLIVDKKLKKIEEKDFIDLVLTNIHQITKLNGDVTPTRQETADCRTRRIFKINGAQIGYLSQKEKTILLTVSNQENWVSKTRRHVEPLGKPGKEHGCLALLPAGIEPKFLPINEARKFRKTHWVVGSAYGKAIILPRSCRPLPIQWSLETKEGLECKKFEKALAVYPIAQVRRVTQRELLVQHTWRGWEGFMIKNSSHERISSEELPCSEICSKSNRVEIFPPETRWILFYALKVLPGGRGLKTEHTILALDNVTPEEIASSITSD